MTSLLAFLLPLLATALATRLVLAWLRRRAILDHPNERSSHTTPTPRGGGLGVVPVVLIAWVALSAAGYAAAPELVIAVAVVLMVVSWLDDRGGLRQWVRLLAHFVAAVACILPLPETALVFQGLLPTALDRAATAILWVWFINLYNFMDGIDGIAGVETATIGLGLAAVAAVSGATDPAALAIGAAGLGFLVWNWHPARIFLGDAGSVPLGFLLGWLLILAATRGDWAAALILPGYYWTDATITLIRRALAGEKFWQAHRSHFYQRALAGGATHAAVSTRIAVVNLLLIASAFEAHAHPAPALIGAAVAIAGLLFALSRMGRATA